MKIENNGNIKSLLSGGIADSGSVNESESKTAKSDAPQAPASANVQLSSLATHLNKAEQAMADTPVVDAQRVAELTQAIREDRFTVDATKVADKLVQTAAELIRAHNG